MAYGIVVEMVCLVFIRFAHDRWFVVLVLFVLFVFVLIVFIRISGRRRVAHDHEELQSDELVENSSRMRGVMLLLLQGKASSKQLRRVSGGCPHG